MQMYYFGSADQPLFGVHHPAQARIQRDSCVVLCPPIGTELLRSYRAFRLLATMLSKQGYDVLRFDYFGTGDSSGACTEGSLDQWRADIETAIEEAAELSGCDKVNLVGLRLGASLAASVATRQRVSKLVLWEPVVEGEAYLQDRIATDLEYETELDHEHKVADALSNAETIGILGFAWTDRFRREISSLSLADFQQLNTERTFLLVREQSDEVDLLRQVLSENAGHFAYECIDHPGQWGEFDALGSLLLPQPVLKAIVACLS